MQGHVLRRDATLSYVVDVGRDPASGRRRQRTKGGYRTKKEAQQALAALIRTLGDGTYVARDPRTFDEWITRRLATMVPRTRSPTLRDDANALARVSERLGQMPLQSLQSLRPLDVEELYALLLKEGGRGGGALAPKTVRAIRAVCGRSTLERGLGNPLTPSVGCCQSLSSTRSAPTGAARCSCVVRRFVEPVV